MRRSYSGVRQECGDVVLANTGQVGVQGLAEEIRARVQPLALPDLQSATRS